MKKPSPMPEDKKLIVLIDDDPMTLELVKELLESKEYRVETFKSFETAKHFLDALKPDLIISDLIGHDDMNGVEFYLRHILEKKIQFAIWSGSLDLTSEKGIQSFGLFLEGMPKDYRVTYDPAKALNQNQVELIVHDYKNNQKTTFPCFAKPGSIDDILKYFKLSGFVILYLLRS